MMPWPDAMNATPHPSGKARDEELGAPATQIVRDRDAYLGQSREVGRRLTDDQYELFVSGDPAEALQREFDRLRPRYIALHDVGTSSSLRLLAAMASTTESKVMRLAVRRQGHGVALATLQFVEIVVSDGETIRAYSTDIDADSHSRHETARMLLSRATLGIVVFGDLPAHAVKPAVQPLLDAVAAQPWATRELVLLPLGLPALLTPFAAAFVARGVHARVASQAPRASDAWTQIGAAWNRLHSGDVSAPATAVVPPTAGTDDDIETTEPMGLRDIGARPAVAPPSAWNDYVNRVASIKGMVSCCVFDRTSGRVLAHAGGRPPAELLQSLGERLLVTASEVGALMGTNAHVQEAHIGYASHHLMLRALPQHRGVVLHAVLDAAHGNLILARQQLQRFDP